MDVREGASATELECTRVITQSQSSPTKRKSSQDDDSDDSNVRSESSKQQQKSAKKERKLAKKARKEERRRNREEKRLRKELRREEKRKRKEFKRKRKSENIDQEESSTNQESVEMDKSRGSLMASKPLKKRKLSRRGSSVADRAEPSDERGLSVGTNGGLHPTPKDPSSTNEGEHDSNEDLDESHPPRKSDAVSSEDDSTKEDTSPLKNKAQSNERKGRSIMSVSNRHSPRTWNERLEALINFKLEHGHTNVPSRNFYDRGLAEFVVEIKNNPDELNDEQRDKLRDLGFDWATGKDKKEQAWTENLNRLERFYKKHKNFAVHRFPQLKKLHGWLLWQRTLHRNGGLREDRKERLEAIGYTDWAPKTMKKSDDKIPKTWTRQYNNLEKYVRINGHSMVPQHKHTENHEDRTLGNWVRKQRLLRNKNCLSAKKIELLEKLNFVWTFDKNNTSLRSGKLRDQRKEFDTSLDLLCQYKQDHGSIDNVQGSMMIGGRNVGQWLLNQKSLFRTGALSNDRKVRLEELGVSFELSS